MEDQPGQARILVATISKLCGGEGEAFIRRMQFGVAQRHSIGVSGCVVAGPDQDHGDQCESPFLIRPSADCECIYLYRHPVDMRKAINGLVAIVEGEMQLDPFTSRLFIFCNRARTLVKMVGWEGNGFVLWMKRLEKTRFKWPSQLPLDVIELNVQQIDWLLDGYELTQMQGHDTLPHHTVL